MNQIYDMKTLFIILGILFILVSIQNVSAENVPHWVKNTAGWWSTDAITEKEFVNAIEFLANNGIIQVNNSLNDKIEFSNDRFSFEKDIFINYANENGDFIGRTVYDKVTIYESILQYESNRDLFAGNEVPLKLENHNFHALDLSGMDLSKSIFTNSDFSWSKLSNSNLSNADLSKSILVNALLINTDLKNTKLTELKK